MIDLGEHATAVISSYVATGVLLAAIVFASLWAAGRARRRLDAIEAKAEARK